MPGMGRAGRQGHRGAPTSDLPPPVVLGVKVREHRVKRAEASRATRACSMRMRVRRGEYLVCGKRAICVIAAIQSRAAVERSRRALLPLCLTSSHRGASSAVKHQVRPRRSSGR